ncbi:MAG: LysR family transcriptional regulator [Vulcanimicrobiaceae bacterium]
MRSLRNLHIFLEVARLGSIRAAAQRLDLSAPAVSMAVGDLQREFDCLLLERVGRGVRLTEDGRELESLGRRAIALLEHAKDAVGGDRRAMRLRIAVVTTTAESFVPPLLESFVRAHPECDVDLDVDNRERLFDRLGHGEVELAIAGRPPATPACRILASRHNDLVIVGAPGSEQIDIRVATWLLREAGSGTRAATRELFAALSIHPPVRSVGSNGAVRACARAALGISLISHDAVAEDIEAGHLVILPCPATPLTRNLHLLASAERSLSRAALRFVAHAVESGVFAAPDR